MVERQLPKLHTRVRFPSPARLPLQMRPNRVKKSEVRGCHPSPSFFDLVEIISRLYWLVRLSIWNGTKERKPHRRHLSLLLLQGLLGFSPPKSSPQSRERPSTRGVLCWLRTAAAVGKGTGTRDFFDST